MNHDIVPFEELNAGARERLAAGVNLYIECQSNDDTFDAPGWLRIRLNQGILERLLAVQRLCVGHSLQLAEIIGGPDAYDERRSAIKYWTMRIDRYDFWLHGQPRDSGSMQSHMVGFRVLWHALNNPEQCAETDDSTNFNFNCRWHGDVLVFSADDVDEFVNVVAEVDAVDKAQMREAAMVELIQQRGAEAAQNAGVNAPPAPRRPQV